MSIFLDLSGPKKIGVERILADLSYSRSSNWWMNRFVKPTTKSIIEKIKNNIESTVWFETMDANSQTSKNGMR